MNCSYWASQDIPPDHRGHPPEETFSGDPRSLAVYYEPRDASRRSAKLSRKMGSSKQKVQIVQLIQKNVPCESTLGIMLST